MDHLPLPQGVTTTVRVSDHCNGSTYPGPFLLAPSEAAIMPAQEEPHENDDFFRQHEIFHPSTTQALQSFLQAWLFFGLLREVLGPTIFAVADYQEQNDGRAIVHTRKLVDALRRWRVQRDQCSQQENAALYRHLERCLRVANASMDVILPPYNHHANFDTQLKWSLAATAEILTRAVGTLVPRERVNLPSSWNMFYKDASIERSMVQQGWCPSLVAASRSTMKCLSALHFIAHLPRSSNVGEHSACLPSVCHSLKINTDNYRSAHDPALSGCKCQHLGVDVNDLVGILSDHKRPLIRITGHDLATVGVQLVARESETSLQYIAISHVWAHGLGSQGDPSVPRCQLLRLKRLLEDLSAHRTFNDHKFPDGEVLLWLDSICVPPSIPNSGPELEEAKGIALSDMRQVYVEAAYTLVLDKALYGTNYDFNDHATACMKLLTSDWMRRLWTFQEAILPRNLVIQFRERAIDLRHLWEGAQVHLDNVKWGTLNQLIGALCAYIRRFFYAQNPVLPTVITMLEGLAYRRTSKEQDQALCASTILGLASRGQIVQLRTHAGRMQLLWKLIYQEGVGIPAALIFNCYSRLSQPGYRWAPATLEQGFEDVSEFYHSPHLQEAGHLVDTGLKCRFAGKFLEPTGPRLAPVVVERLVAARSNMIRLLDGSGTWYSLGPKESNLTGRQYVPDFLHHDRKDLVRHDKKTIMLIEHSVWDTWNFPDLQRCLVGGVEDPESPEPHVTSRALCLLRRSNQMDQNIYTIALAQAVTLRQQHQVPEAFFDPGANVTNEAIMNLLVRADQAAIAGLAAHPARAAQLLQHSPYAHRWISDTIIAELCGGFARLIDVDESRMTWVVD